MFVIDLEGLLPFSLFIYEQLTMEMECLQFTVILYSYISYLFIVKSTIFTFFSYGGDKFLGWWYCLYLCWYPVCFCVWWNWFVPFWWWKVFPNYLLKIFLNHVGRNCCFCVHVVCFKGFKDLIRCDLKVNEELASLWIAFKISVIHSKIIHLALELF